MTRLLITTAIIAALASPAYAGDHSSGNNQGGNAFAGAAAGAAASSRSAATAGGGAGGQGGSGGSANSGATVNNNVSAGNGSGGGWNGGPGQWPAFSAYAPSYALGSMCQEATSGGVSIFWAGISGGGVRTMDFCVVKMKADHFRSLGNERMAKAMECANKELREAYKATGQPCPADTPQTAAASPEPSQRVLNAGGLQCFDAAGNPVALGQPGSVRCQ